MARLSPVRKEAHRKRDEDFQFVECLYSTTAGLMQNPNQILVKIQHNFRDLCTITSMIMMMAHQKTVEYALVDVPQSLNAYSVADYLIFKSSKI